MEGYSQSVINLFNELKGKRKLVDIVNLLEDLTECYINKHQVPIEILLNDLDVAVESDMFKGFSTIEIKKIYKVVNKYDQIYTKIPSFSKDMTTSEKLIKVIESVNDGNTREIDEFILKLRRRLTLRISGSDKKVNMTEEYHDEFNAHYVRLFEGNKDKEFAIIVIQNKLILYYSLLTRRQYPVNLKKTSKGLDTLMNIFVENDLEFIENNNK